MYTNTVNNKKYIGATTQLLEDRNKQHIWNRNDGTYFHNSIIKYGIDKFTLEVIDSATTIEELYEKEVYWIKFHKTKLHGYNLTDGGRGGTGYNHSKETIEKLRSINMGENNPMYGAIFSDEHRLRMSVSKIGIGLGRKVSEETKKKMSESKLGLQSGENNPMYGKNHSEATKEKIRNNRKAVSGKDHKQSKAVVQLSLEGNYISEFGSASEASRFINGDFSTICKVCNGKLKQHKGFIWMFKVDYDKKLMEEEQDL